MSKAPPPLRRWTAPRPGEDWAAIAARALPELPETERVAALQGWNPHLVFRPPPAVLTCTDVVFTEAPRAH